ncbi:hypothetical protein NL50_02260 [Clostridium acetobutylicum]|nr:hypothetical protein NL50_02260 [Clostridium acetobutylicum]
MEFRLNKIEPEVRKRVSEITKEGKVHDKTKQEFKVNPENQKNKEKGKYKFSKNDKKILVKAVKEKKIEVEAVRDDETQTLGKFLDVKE